MTGTATPGGPRRLRTGPPSRADVPDLTFAVAAAQPLPHAAVPTVAFRIGLRREGGGPVRSVSLTADVRIAPARRRYENADRLIMTRLFGQPEQWATSMHPLGWARVSTVVPPFDRETEIELPVPCTRESELAVTSYFDAVRDGSVPLDFLFSGTVFHTAVDGRLRTAQISWAQETGYDLPAGLWHELLARYGGAGWLQVSAGTRDALSAYRERHTLSGWDETVRHLLARERPAGERPARDETTTPDDGDVEETAAWTP